MTPEEIAAYIGAAAWLPQIISWISKSLTKPKLRIVPNQFAEVGFSNFGPIFNVRMAFFVENRDLIIDGVDLIIRHEDGDAHEFRWAGLGETFSEITDASGNKQIVGRDQTPIAIKVNTDSLIEKFVRFQEPRFHKADATATKNFLSQLNFLKQKDPVNFISQVLASKEYFDAVEQRQKWFYWKPGRYEVIATPSSPQKFKLEGAPFAFELSSIEVTSLQRNIPLIQTEINNIIFSNLPGPPPQIINWQWANVMTLRK